MATTAQSRLDRLLSSRPKLQPRKTGTLHFSEQEILDYQKRQRPPVGAKYQSNDLRGAPFSKKTADHPLQTPTNSQPPVAAVTTQAAEVPIGERNDHFTGKNAGNTSHQTGRRRAGDQDTLDNGRKGESWLQPEPESSSTELVGCFCLWALVSKFCYKYMKDPEDDVSRLFFAGGKIFERNWPVYYITGPESCGYKPLILVPIENVKQLILDISSEFEVLVDLPPYPFQLSFYKDGTQVPQHLGLVNSKADMANVQATIPFVPATRDQISSDARERQKQDNAAWLEKIETAFAAEKKRNAIKRGRAGGRNLTVGKNLDQLIRAQRYLGLRKKLPCVETIRSEQGKYKDELLDRKTTLTDLADESLDTNKPAPCPFEDETVIIAIDVESWEMDHSIITEIGVSTLDTTDLITLAPGEEGLEWLKKIRSRHFRVKGREQLRNVQYCSGNPDQFRFGTSEFVAIADAAEAIDRCFETPYSAGFECAGPPEIGADGLPIPRTAIALDISRNNHDPQPRNLLLVGHDIDADIMYLSQLGSSIFGSGPPVSIPKEDAARRRRVLSCIREKFDTAVLYKSLNKAEQTRSLTKVCHELDITAWSAHNAGNDARYTLEVFIKLVLKARQHNNEVAKLAREKGSYDAEAITQEIESEQRMDIKIEAPQERVDNDLAAFSNAVTSGTH